MPIGIPKGTILHHVPRTEAQNLEIRGDYARGALISSLQKKYRRGRIALNEILGIVPEKRHQGGTNVSQATTITPVVQPEAISPLAFVLAFEERVREYHIAIGKLTQERDEARNETSSLRVSLMHAVNGGKADLEQLEAAGKRISSPLGGG